MLFLPLTNHFTGLFLINFIVSVLVSLVSITQFHIVSTFDIFLSYFLHFALNDLLHCILFHVFSGFFCRLL